MKKAKNPELEQAAVLIEHAKEIIESTSCDEQERFDNTPEAIRQSEVGQALDQILLCLGDAVYHLEQRLRT